jgi:hypothetical protein
VEQVVRIAKRYGQGEGHQQRGNANTSILASRKAHLTSEELASYQGLERDSGLDE